MGYFEHLNEQHKAAQGQLFKASDYEYTAGKDGGLHHQDLQVTLNKLLQDEQSIGMELDRLKQHSDQMLRDQSDLRGETEALNGHMATLNNQNFGLQRELGDFVQCDEAVKRNLDRKYRVND